MATIALTFFLITNPIGNSPAIVALIKDFPEERQKAIMLREGIFTLLLALFFQYFGELFLGLITAKNYTVTMGGGVLLIVCALSMIFPAHENGESKKGKREPFLVPIATPLLSGPGLLTIIMFFSSQTSSSLKISSAIFLSWIGVMGVLTIAPYLQRLIGKRGLFALEQLMGMILAMMGIEMVATSVKIFARTFS